MMLRIGGSYKFIKNCATKRKYNAKYYTTEQKLIRRSRMMNALKMLLPLAGVENGGGR